MGPTLPHDLRSSEEYLNQQPKKEEREIAQSFATWLGMIGWTWSKVFNLFVKSSREQIPRQSHVTLGPPQLRAPYSYSETVD